MMVPRTAITCRGAGIYARKGVPIERSTLAGWVEQARALLIRC